MTRLLLLVACLSTSRAVVAQERREDAISEERLHTALDHFAHEPTARELLAVADATPAFDPRRAERLARRSRRSGWLPTIRFGTRRGQARDLDTQLESDDPTRLSTDDDLTLEGALTMRLDRAFYGQDEIGWAREARSREMLREERARALIAAYYERRRLQLEGLLHGRRDLAVRVRILELEALLDTLTSGAFTRMMRAHSR